MGDPVYSAYSVYLKKRVESLCSVRHCDDCAGNLRLFYSVCGPLKGGAFSAAVRALGVGLPYAVANAAFGGTAEYIALWMKSRGVESSFYWYVTVLCLMSLLIAWRMPDPQRCGYLRD